MTSSLPGLEGSAGACGRARPLPCMLHFRAHAQRPLPATAQRSFRHRPHAIGRALARQGGVEEFGMQRKEKEGRRNACVCRRRDDVQGIESRAADWRLLEHLRQLRPSTRNEIIGKSRLSRSPSRARLYSSCRGLATDMEPEQASCGFNSMCGVRGENI